VKEDRLFSACTWSVWVYLCNTKGNLLGDFEWFSTELFMSFPRKFKLFTSHHNWRETKVYVRTVGTATKQSLKISVLYQHGRRSCKEAWFLHRS